MALGTAVLIIGLLRKWRIFISSTGQRHAVPRRGLEQDQWPKLSGIPPNEITRYSKKGIRGTRHIGPKNFTGRRRLCRQARLDTRPDRMGPRKKPGPSPASGALITRGYFSASGRRLITRGSTPSTMKPRQSASFAHSPP
jgi:hypothetical protein